MSTALANTHISLDSKGRTRIEGADASVLQVAADRYAHGWSAEEIHFQHPHLSVARIHAALSYYYDRQEDMGAAIEQEWSEAGSLKALRTPSQAEERVRASGRIP